MTELDLPFASRPASPEELGPIRATLGAMLATIDIELCGGRGECVAKVSRLQPGAGAEEASLLLAARLHGEGVLDELPPALPMPQLQAYDAGSIMPVVEVSYSDIYSGFGDPALDALDESVGFFDLDGNGTNLVWVDLEFVGANGGGTPESDPSKVFPAEYLFSFHTSTQSPLCGAGNPASGNPLVPGVFGGSGVPGSPLDVLLGAPQCP